MKFTRQKGNRKNDTTATIKLTNELRLAAATKFTMTARLHHYVPQLYLRGFCRDLTRPRLLVVDAVAKRAFETSTRNVAAERDFNCIEIDGFAPDKLEMDLQSSRLSAAIRRRGPTAPDPARTHKH
jgi:hypothetical protein